MNVFRNPKICMWFGRLAPAMAWGFWLLVILVPGFSPGDSRGGMEFLFVLWVVSLAAYLLWVYFLLPELLFEDGYRGLPLRTVYFAFTALTAGLGQVIWYFIRVDPILRRMVAARKRT